MNRHSLVTLAKKIIYPNGEPYLFNGKKLYFKAGSRPIRRKYINSDNGVVRNDLLQIEYFEKNFTANDILWDIGSHHGHYTVFAASIVKGDKQIFSFEPDQVARQLQLQNLKLNGLHAKVHVLEIAVGTINGPLKFKSQGGDSNSHLVSSAYTGCDPQIISVKGRTMNDLLKDLPAPTFIKIDTEGAEIDILSEASDLLADQRVKFICELHPFAWDIYHSSFEQFQSIMHRYGRRLELLDKTKSLESLPFYGTVLF